MKQRITEDEANLLAGSINNYNMRFIVPAHLLYVFSNYMKRDGSLYLDINLSDDIIYPSPHPTILFATLMQPVIERRRTKA